MKSVDVLVLPGWQSSGPEHWQSRWEAVYGYQRVEQHDWLRPLRGDWIARLEEVLLEHKTPVTLVAHSLGCLLVAAWAAHSRNPQFVKGAFLVAPGDPANAALQPVLANWSSVDMRTLPFPSLLVASRNDPYCSFERARSFAQAWGATFFDCGTSGHINADSALGAWPEGHELLSRWASELAPPFEKI